MTDEQGSPAPWYDRDELTELLRRLGADDEEIATALDTDTPGALALEVAVRRGRPAVPAAEAARRAALSDEEFAEVWRALGLTASSGPQRVPPAIADSLPVLTAAIRDWLGEQTGLGLARVIGSTTAQLAEAVVDAFRMRYEVPELAGGMTYTEVVERYVELTRASLPSLEQLVAATLEAHLVRVAAGAWAPDDDQVSPRRLLFVGFADLVGYTALSRTLTPGELHRLLATFEQAVAEAVAGQGGRLVKLIGDGAMYVADTAAAGCAAALDICERTTASELPPVRVGADIGPVMSRSGDYFGEVVNRAARLVALARPASVVVTDAVVDALGAGWPVEQLPPQALKGFQAPAVTYRLVAR
ncbi:MAG TPA: adenylate/guanylate cyclase domain-containing protein [Mycobacteriales bacterium]|nr:adenylate/guanylate cyclase domain-containing protein [Mycobacteriales bacterium]